MRSPLKPQGAARHRARHEPPPRMGEEMVIRFRVGRNIRKGVVKAFGDDKLLYSPQAACDIPRRWSR